MSEPYRLSGSRVRCGCQCHSSEAYKHIAACCCSHQYVFNQCPICDDPGPKAWLAPSAPRATWELDHSLSEVEGTLRAAGKPDWMVREVAKARTIIRQAVSDREATEAALKATADHKEKRIHTARLTVAALDARGINYALEMFAERYGMPDTAEVSIEPVNLNPSSGTPTSGVDLILGWTITAQWRI